MKKCILGSSCCVSFFSVLIKPLLVILSYTVLVLLIVFFTVC